MSTVAITVGGIDVTDSVIFRDAEFTAAAKGAVGTCSFRVRDDTHIRDFTVGAEIILTVDGTRKWGGYVGQVKRGYFWDAWDCKCKVNVVPRYLLLVGQDYNLLLNKRVLYDKTTPTTMQLTSFPADTTDKTVIDYYLTNHTDLLADGVTLVTEHVGTPSTDDAISGSASWTINQFLQMIAFNTGAIWYMDPNKNFVYTDIDSANASVGLSDSPGAGEVGCRELEIDFDGSSLRNDALVWGAGQGNTLPVFSRVADNTSVVDHDRWQVAQFNASVWKQATVDRIANSYVFGSPQNKRGGKDDAVSVRCVVFNDAFVVAQKVVLRSAVFGYTDTLPIRSQRITFPTNQDVRSDLTLGFTIDDPWSSLEFWWPTWTGIGPVIPKPVLPLPPSNPCPPVCPTVVFDSFSRVVSNGWGTSDIGATWVDHGTGGGAGGLSVSGGIGYQNTGIGVPVSAQAAITTSGPWSGEFTLDWRFQFSGFLPFTSPSLNLGFLGIIVRFNIDDAFFPNIQLVGPTETVFIPFTFSSDLWYRAKWHHWPNTVSEIKLWIDGDPEPTDWMLVRNASLDGQAAGLGFFVTANGPATSPPSGSPLIVQYDYLNIAPCNTEGSGSLVRWEDTFDNRTIGLGTNSVDWGMSSAGDAWTLQLINGSPSGNFAGVLSGEGIMHGRLTYGQDQHAVVTPSSAQGLESTELFAQFVFTRDWSDTDPDGGQTGSTADILFECEGTVNTEDLFVELKTNLNVPVFGFLSNVDSTANVALSYDTIYSLRWLRDANAMLTKAKIWESSLSEPDWMITSAMTTIGGLVNLRVHGAEGKLGGALPDDTPWTEIHFLDLVLSTPDPCSGDSPPPADNQCAPQTMCQDLTQIATPLNQPDVYTYWATAHGQQWYPGSTEVWVDGLRIRLGYDYDENYVDGYIAIHAGGAYTSSKVHMCFVADCIAVTV